MRDGSWKCTQGTAGRVPACCLLLAPYLSTGSTMVKSACCLLLSACTISLQKLACCRLVHHISSTPRLWSSWALSRWPDAPDGQAVGWCTRLSWLLCYISWCCFPGASWAIGVARPSLLVFFSDILPVVVLTNLAGKQVRYYVTNVYPMVRYVLILTYTWYKFVPCGETCGTILSLVVRSLVQKPILVKSGQGMLVPVPGLRCGLVVGSIIFLTSASPVLFLLLISSIIF